MTEMQYVGHCKSKHQGVFGERIEQGHARKSKLAKLKDMLQDNNLIFLPQSPAHRRG